MAIRWARQAGGAQFGAYTASSMHDGGVNVQFLDGHVQFVSNSIELAVWRDFGSRARSDPVEFLN